MGHVTVVYARVTSPNGNQSVVALRRITRSIVAEVVVQNAREENKAAPNRLRHYGGTIQTGDRAGSSARRVVYVVTRLLACSNVERGRLRC